MIISSSPGSIFEIGCDTQLIYQSHQDKRCIGSNVDCTGPGFLALRLFLVSGDKCVYFNLVFPGNGLIINLGRKYILIPKFISGDNGIKFNVDFSIV
jgi:hypothetical protein